MNRAMFKASLLCGGIFLLVLPVEEARGAGCEKTCVEVKREGGDLVITAHRDPVRRRVAPAISNPVPTSTPTPRKSSHRRAHRSHSSLSDQIREALPRGSFSILPKRGAVIYEPLLIHSSGCSEVKKSLPILDTTIYLELRPQVQWRWGDGTSERWNSGVQTRGAHIYRRAGRYRVEMECHWGGSFRTPQSPWMPIPQGIFSSYNEVIQLFRAEIFFTE